MVVVLLSFICVREDREWKRMRKRRKKTSYNFVQFSALLFSHLKWRIKWVRRVTNGRMCRISMFVRHNLFEMFRIAALHTLIHMKLKWGQFDFIVFHSVLFILWFSIFERREQFYLRIGKRVYASVFVCAGVRVRPICEWKVKRMSE